MKNKLKRLMSVMLAVMIMCSLFSINASAATKTITTVKTGKYYTIKNVASGKYINCEGVTSKKKLHGNNVDTYALEKGSADQQWKFTYNSKKKAYYIIPKANTKVCLNPNSDKPTNNVNVNLCTTYSNDVTQMYKIEYISKYKAYVIRSAYNTNLVVAANGKKNGSNVRLEKYVAGDKSQLWTCGAFSTKTSTTDTAKAASDAAKTAASNTVSNASSKLTTKTVSGVSYYTVKNFDKYIMQQDPTNCYAVSEAMCASMTKGKTFNKYAFQNGSGLAMHTNFIRDYYGNDEKKACEAIAKQLKSGCPVVIHAALMDNGYRGNGAVPNQHAVVIVGYKKSANVNKLAFSDLLIVDPSKYNSGDSQISNFTGRYKQEIRAPYTIEHYNG